jgi:hypothetical protein
MKNSKQRCKNLKKQQYLFEIFIDKEFLTLTFQIFTYFCFELLSKK